MTDYPQQGQGHRCFPKKTRKINMSVRFNT